MYLALWLSRRWRLPATPALILPDAVILKRFFAPDLVFSFGISHRALGTRPSGRVHEPPWHAFGQAVRKGRAFTRNRGRRQGELGRSLPRPPGLRPAQQRHAGEGREDRARHHADARLSLQDLGLREG